MTIRKANDTMESMVSGWKTNRKARSRPVIKFQVALEVSTVGSYGLVMVRRLSFHIYIYIYIMKMKGRVVTSCVTIERRETRKPWAQRRHRRFSTGLQCFDSLFFVITGVLESVLFLRALFY